MFPAALFLLATLSPAEAAWTQTAEKHGCVFSKAPPEGEALPLRAECRWSIPPDKVAAQLRNWEGHDEVFSSVASSRVLGSEGSARRVLQTHVASGISDRFVVLATTEQAIEGGQRFSFRLASDQAEARAQAEAEGGVVPTLDTGTWEVRGDGSGGSVVTYELRYQAGGSVPGFMVRAFQGGGFQDMLAELKAAAG